MAETSLARQLRKLAVPQTAILLQDKIHASLLFDPREASGIDKDTIYAIGLSGLEELELIDPTFSQFHKNLFNESWKTMERSVQNRETNQQLDAVIDNFLTMVSPYFLLRPAHKTLEWLICRFHIHLFNVDSLIATILPFHESKIFVRTLQLLNLRDASGKWHWLEPLQKNGISLPKSTLITHCYKELSFMKFVCNLVPRILEVYSGHNAVCHTPISFYAVVTLGALERADEITENMVALLMPYLVQGLKSDNVDYCASTYMIICQLAKKVTLKNKFLDKMLTRVIQNAKKEIFDECSICLLVVFQHQNILKLQSNMLLAFCRKPALTKRLVSLAEKNHLQPLFTPLFKSLIVKVLMLSAKIKTAPPKRKKKSTWSYAKLLTYLLSNLPLTDNVVGFAVQFLLKKYLKYYGRAIKNPREFSSRGVQKKARKIIEKFEKRYPKACDSTVERYIAKVEPKKKRFLRKMINQSVMNPKHNLLASSNTSLFLSLNHPSAARRQMGMTSLVEMLKKQTPLTDPDFVCNSLLKGLLDESPMVVESVLYLEGDLFVLLPQEELMRTLCSALKANASREQQECLRVRTSILTLLCYNQEAVSRIQNDLVMQILPFVVPLVPEEVELAVLILKSNLAKQHPILDAWAQDVFLNLPFHVACKNTCSFETLDEIGKGIIHSFTKSILESERLVQNEMMDALSKACQDGESPGSSVLTTMFLNVITRQVKIGFNERSATLALKLMSDWISKKKYADHQWRECLMQEMLPIRIFCVCLTSLIYHSKGKENEDFRSTFFTWLTDLPTDAREKWGKIYTQLLTLFFKVQFADASEQIVFLAKFWTSSVHVLRVRSLYMTTVILDPSLASWLFAEGREEVIALLSCLISPIDIVREAAIKCLQKSLDCSEGIEMPYSSLVAYLLEQSEEIQLDQNHLPQLMSVWLSEALSNTPASSGVRTRSQAINTIAPHPVSVLNSLLATCNHSSRPELRQKILIMLSYCKSEFVLSELLPVLSDEIKNCENIGKVSSESASNLRLLFSHYNMVTAPLLSQPGSMAYSLLEKSILSAVKGGSLQDNIQQMALRVLSKKFFQAIPSRNVQKDVMNLILETYVDCENSILANQQFKAFKKLTLHSDLIGKLLQLPDQTLTKQTVKEARLSRALTNEEQNNGAALLEQKEWKKILAVLEILPAKEEVEDTETLVPILFDLLNRSLEMESGPQTEYFRQLVLSSLNTCCQKAEDGKLQEQHLQVELAVQCIRISSNPHTQQLALALLITAAVIFPDHVLHNIMAIFTFMGTSLVRQEDSYSFQMTLKTVDTIIPALLQASQHQSKETKTDQVISAVTRVFVDALQDIPQHRRVPLFSRLITTLGPSDNLWLPLGQLFDSIVARGSKQDHSEDKNHPEEIEFGISLCQSFKPSIQAKTCLKIIDYIASLPTEKNENNPNMNSATFPKVFDLPLRSEKQLRHFKYVGINFISSLLSSKAFIAQVAELEGKSSRRMESLFRQMLESTLQYIQEVARQTQIHSRAPSCKFWRSLLHKLYELLDKINSLLPGQQFITVIGGLMHHPLPSVRRKAMEMLNSKLLHQQQFFRTEDIPSLLELVKPLAKAAKRSKDPEEGGDREEMVLNQQTALFALKLLCKLAGASNPAIFKKVLSVVVKLLRHSQHQQQLVSSALLCLAELCHSLKENCLPSLNKFMNPVLELLQDLETLESNELLLLSVITAVHRLVENLSSFLSTFMPTIMTQVCLLMKAHPDTEATTKSAPHLRMKAVATHMACDVPLRVLLPAARESYERLENMQKLAVCPLMAILREKMASVEKDELTDHLPELQDFFMMTLEFRSRHRKTSLQDVNKVEESIVQALQGLVLKLSETSFRPFFYKIYDWATSEEDDERDRLLTFYSLTDSLAEKLKSIFVLFASHFVANAASVLDSTNNSKTEEPFFGDHSKSVQKCCQLVTSILSTLQCCFLYDNKHLTDKDCFTTLMQPLVDQIENTVGDEESYKKRIDENVAPCLAQFAVATSDDTCWKPLNYQILLKTRSSLPMVRFAALQVVREVVVKLGENYMVLLPESIPFLAELMEDESFEVEQQCQSVVVEMEQILGESLTKYF